LSDGEDSGREAKQAPQAGEILVTTVDSDQIQLALDHLQLPHRTLSCPEIEALPLRADGLLFVNSPGAFSDAGLEALLRFVTVGGTLISSNRALETTVQRAFPGTIEHAGERADDLVGGGVVEVSGIDPHSPFTRGVEVPGQPIRWRLAQDTCPIRVLDERVGVLLRSQELGPLAVAFGLGEGMVFHLTSHLDLQRSDYGAMRLLANIVYARRRTYGVDVVSPGAKPPGHVPVAGATPDQGETALLVDASVSMARQEGCLELAAQVGRLLDEALPPDHVLHLCAFEGSARPLLVPRGSDLDDWRGELTLDAEGSGTSVGSALVLLAESEVQLERIVIVTDGYESRPPRLVQSYRRYLKAVQGGPPELWLVQPAGSGEQLAADLREAQIPCSVFLVDGGLDGLVQALAV
jgi:hypothetical protein